MTSAWFLLSTKVCNVAVIVTIHSRHLREPVDHPLPLAKCSASFCCLHFAIERAGNAPNSRGHIFLCGDTGVVAARFIVSSDQHTLPLAVESEKNTGSWKDLKPKTIELSFSGRV
jgi:hypothetical protein